MAPQERDDVRPIAEDDIRAVIELYRRCYGPNYPFKEFYSPEWIKKGVFNDEIHWLVAEGEDGRPMGSGAVMLEAGDHDDLLGEFGRMVVDPDSQGGGFGRKVMESLDRHAERIIEFGFAEARTAHTGSQKILSRVGFTPMGFEPLKYRLAQRESMVFFGKLYGQASSLRNPSPLIIPEVEPLAERVTGLMGLPTSLQVDPYAGRYPVARELEAVVVEQTRLPRLLRIGMAGNGRPELFGALHLNYGFFRIKAKEARYLVARDPRRGDRMVGVVGYTVDDIDDKARIFELSALDDFVKGFLVDEVVSRLAGMGLEYLEADVSAYSPRMQKTFAALGFVPAAYAPAMVFQDSERLDIVRFVRLAGAPPSMDGIHVLDDGRSDEVVRLVLSGFAAG